VAEKIEVRAIVVMTTRIEMVTEKVEKEREVSRNTSVAWKT